MSSPSLVEYIRSYPTISVQQHQFNVTEKVPIRSERVLLSRGPSFPALVLDTSAEHVEENLFRRSLHSRIMTSNSGAFRRFNFSVIFLLVPLLINYLCLLYRKKTKDGPVASMEEISKMRDLLGTMHPYKDPNDIDKSHKYSSSRRIELDKLERTNLEEYQFANMKPIDDFLQPGDATSPRRTGYEQGHIRNVMKLDTFGPNNSRQNTRERERSGGLLPPPNLDRFATMSTVVDRTKTFGSLGSGPHSANSSRPSTAQSSVSLGTTSDQSSHMLRTLQSSPELRIAPSLRSLYLNRPTTPVELIMPSSLRKETYRTGENRITVEDRQLYDPFVKRKHYSRVLTQRVKSSAEKTQFKNKINKYVQEQQELANVERRKIREFERHVSLAKFEP
jgi:hypothetical protein